MFTVFLSFSETIEVTMVESVLELDWCGTREEENLLFTHRPNSLLALLLFLLFFLFLAVTKMMTGSTLELIMSIPKTSSQVFYCSSCLLPLLFCNNAVQMGAHATKVLHLQKSWGSSPSLAT
jgi:hypothetical protein